jgi:hypothetical protein
VFTSFLKAILLTDFPLSFTTSPVVAPKVTILSFVELVIFFICASFVTFDNPTAVLSNVWNVLSPL